ncbi:MAG: hypothetical protein LBC80_07925 [Treponema sp.]|jgi:hypothetical protein|nr:hypothetical protein [Treponema sp.]
MRLNSLPKYGLLVYEVLRVLLLGTILITRADDGSYFVKMIFATQGVLFPLMALFLCIDAVRYKEYIPLFIAGKSVGVFVLLTISLFSRMNVSGISETFGFVGEMRLVFLDLIAIITIFMIKKDVNELVEPETEEK